MRIKHFLLPILIMLFAGLTANAQTKSIDLDNFRFPVTYRTMPDKPFDPLFFTYAAYVEATKSTEQRVVLSEIESGLYIEGQQQVNNNEDAFLTIVLKLGNLIVKSSNVVERKSEHKDRDGKVSVNYFYTLVVEYTFETSYVVFQGDKELNSGGVRTSFVGDGRTYTYRSQEYSNRKDAASYWNNNKEILVSEFATKLSNDAARTLSYNMSKNYGFEITKTTDILQVTDEKKHLENEAFKAACATVKEKMEAVTPNQGLNKDELEGVIEYFKSIPAKYTDPKHKADVRLRYAAYYNLCKIYLYLEEPENVYPYADLLFQNGYDKKDGEKLKKAATELAAELNKTEIKTRHFNPEDYFAEN